ncbi:hypothetical protein QTO34_001219 [Cnephaeus nilssonii]|uniref:Ribosome production factor 2 homolog n=1 Tax=Cnephaeus nilssonii TaxID=3371016 RepID=A0AA40HVG5_CNENI|nr:hypothetical protein QTO34_001219 [Eptesicus nilssonii]
MCWLPGGRGAGTCRLWAAGERGCAGSRAAGEQGLPALGGREAGTCRLLGGWGAGTCRLWAAGKQGRAGSWAAGERGLAGSWAAGERGLAGSWAAGERGLAGSGRPGSRDVPAPVAGERKPKTKRAKRFLEKREPKLSENIKNAMLIKGGNANSAVTQVLRDVDDRPGPGPPPSSLSAWELGCRPRPAVLVTVCGVIGGTIGPLLTPALAWHRLLTCSTIPLWSRSCQGPLGSAVLPLPPPARATSPMPAMFRATSWWSAHIIEFFSKKSDCSLFMFGSHNKKRPNNLVIGRMYDYHVLDMIELGIEKFVSLKDIKNSKCPEGTKPMLIFAGNDFDVTEDYRRLKSLLIGKLLRLPHWQLGAGPARPSCRSCRPCRKLAMALKSFCRLAHITWLLRSRLEALISKMVACERYCLMLSHQPQLLQLLLLKAQAEEGL